MMGNVTEIWTKYKMYIIGGIVFVFLFFTRAGKRMFKSSPRKRRRVVRPKTVIRRRTSVLSGNRRRSVSRRPARKSLPRSVGRKGYPAAGGGVIPFKYNKNGTIKKAQFVAGTLAAKRRMATLRKNR